MTEWEEKLLTALLRKKGNEAYADEHPEDPGWDLELSDEMIKDAAVLMLEERKTT